MSGWSLLQVRAGGPTRAHASLREPLFFDFMPCTTGLIVPKIES